MGGRRTLGTLVALAIGVAGCGGSDTGEASDSGATGAAESGDITVAEFLPKVLPEKEVALEAVVATSDACADVSVEPSFVLVVSDAASKADPDTPLTEIVESEC